MKRIKISSYILRTKWLVVALVTIVLIIFGRLANAPSLISTAIVIGIGVDYQEESKEFEVTSQTVMVGASSGDTSQTTYNTYTGKGKTLAGALDDISRKMGLNVSLSHCNVLFVSQSALKLDHLQLLHPLIGMYELPEQAIIISGDKSPREMIAIRLGTTTSAPYFLQSALINLEGSNGMIRTTVKDFLARSLSRSGSAVIPYITAQKLQDQPMTGQENMKDNYEFDFTHSLAVSHSKSKIIEKEMAEILAIYFSKNVSGTLNYTADNNETVEFKILKKDLSVKADKRNISAELEISVDLLDVQHMGEKNIFSGANETIIKYADELAKKIEDTLKKMFELSKEIDIDFLNLQAKAYQSVGRDLEEDCLSTLSYTPSVKLTFKEAA